MEIAKKDYEKPEMCVILRGGGYNIHSFQR